MLKVCYRVCYNVCSRCATRCAQGVLKVCSRFATGCAQSVLKIVLKCVSTVYARSESVQCAPWRASPRLDPRLERRAWSWWRHPTRRRDRSGRGGCLNRKRILTTGREVRRRPVGARRMPAKRKPRTGERLRVPMIGVTSAAVASSTIVSRSAGEACSRT